MTQQTEPTQTEPTQTEPTQTEPARTEPAQTEVARPPRWRALPAYLRRRWRRSVQVRVVVTTLLASSMVLLLVGVLLLQQVATGMLTAKRRSAVAEFDAGYNQASTAFSDADPSEPARAVLDRVTEDLAQRGAPVGLYAVVILPSGANLSGRASPDTLDPASVPDPLRAAVLARTDVESWQFTTIRYLDATSLPGMAVGRLLPPLSGQEYQLYLLFPLVQERETLSLVTNTVLVAGLLLVVLLAGIVALVTRQVVVPVRLAATTAGQLAAGDLSPRLEVQGEDELARLGQSFNRMADNLQTQIEQLEGLSRLQQRFVSDVSHELRTPLTTVRMAVDVMYDRRETFPVELARSAELLHAEVDRFEALLADLLEISRFDAGAATLDVEETDLRDVVRRVVNAVGGLAVRRGVDIQLRLPVRSCTADVDPPRVERILRNLVVNAIEHAESRPVVVTVARGRAAVAVAVRDFGVGLRPGDSAKVFDRFWRADPARARTTGGTGLGLAIALEDARLHGGWLQAWGELGVGAQFRLTLPLHPGGELTSSPLPLVPFDVTRPPPAAPGAVAGAVVGGADLGRAVVGGADMGRAVVGGADMGRAVVGEADMGRAVVGRVGQSSLAGTSDPHGAGPVGAGRPRAHGPNLPAEVTDADAGAEGSGAGAAAPEPGPGQGARRGQS